jgi:hypothetical protein
MRASLSLVATASLLLLATNGCGASHNRPASPPSGVVTDMRIGSNAPTLAGPEPADGEPRAASPERVFARAHGDPLMLAKQPPGVPSADALTHYRIDQQIDDRSATLSGTVTIRMTNRTGKALVELPLVLHPNSARELGVAASDSGNVTITGVEHLAPDGTSTPLEHREVRPTLVRVKLAAPVKPDEAIAIEVSYRGTLRQLSDSANSMMSQALGSLAKMKQGVGGSDYGLLAVGDGILTAASAYPMVAPFHDGAFDTAPPAELGDLAYNDIANFEATTRVPKGFQLVTNLVDDTPQSKNAGWETVVSKGTHVRDFVLVGGRDLARSHLEVDDTRVTSVYRTRDAQAGKRALAMAAASLRSFEKRFGPYPYRELDVAEASLVGGAGGVEFNGMVLVAGMLYRDPIASDPLLGMLAKFGGGGADALGPMRKQLQLTLDFTVAHEVAHQYFAGIVGNDSHRFPSLDEPIAQYAAGLAIEDRYGKATAGRAMDTHVKINYAMYRMLGGRDKPVLRDTKSFTSPTEYAALVYGKAPYVYVRLRQRLGDDKLHGAIRAAVDEHRFGLATTDEWIDSLERHAGGKASKIRPAFTRWLKQTHADADLGVDGSGDFVIDTMMPPGMAKQLQNSTGGMLDPKSLIKGLLKGAM